MRSVLPAVFTSTEEADRLEAEQAKLERVKWCGILHPETGTSIVYNQMHIIFLMYMMAVLPVRTAFQITPGVSDWDFWADVVVDTSIGIDIILNFRCAKGVCPLSIRPPAVAADVLRLARSYVA